MKANIGITTENFQEASEIFSTILTEGMLLYIKTRKFHWNVSGESVLECHKLFESHYKMLEEAIDEVAERINKFGNTCIGNKQGFSTLSHMNEHTDTKLTSKDMLTELLNDHETLINSLRNKLMNVTNN